MFSCVWRPPRFRKLVIPIPEGLHFKLRIFSRHPYSGGSTSPWCFYKARIQRLSTAKALLKGAITVADPGISIRNFHHPNLPTPLRSGKKDHCLERFSMVLWEPHRDQWLIPAGLLTRKLYTPAKTAPRHPYPLYRHFQDHSYHFAFSPIMF